MSAETKAVLDAAEKSLDVIEDKLDVLEEAAEHVRPWKLNLNGTTKGQQIGILTGAVLLGVVGGGVGGYFLARKQLSMKLRMHYEGIAEKEIADAKAHYESLNIAREKPLSPEEVLARLHSEEKTDASETEQEAVQAMHNYQGVTVNREEVEVSQHNIFTNPAPTDEPAPVEDNGWDYETELKIREENPGRPYIISEEEFFEGEKEYEQTSLTYYEADDTLSDDKGVAVPDSDATVGDDNLMRFGHGTKDEHMLYVRNERLELDFEIALSKGKYTVEVLGFDDEDALKHSYGRPGIRKFRGHDD